MKQKLNEIRESIYWAVLFFVIGIALILRGTVTAYMGTYLCMIACYAHIWAARHEYRARRRMRYENNLYEQSTRW